MRKWIDEFQGETYTAASLRYRIRSRAFDILLMFVIGIFVKNALSEKHIFYVFGFVVLFYLAFYSPVMDSMANGTVGKHLVGLRLWDAYKWSTHISLALSYKRVFTIMWPGILASLLFMYYAENFVIDGSDLEEYSNGYYVYYVACTLYFIQFIYALPAFARDNGQSWHDRVSGTIVVRHKKVKEEKSIAESFGKYEEPVSIWRANIEMKEYKKNRI